MTSKRIGQTTVLPTAGFAESRYAVIDFETTGGAQYENKIIEIGLVLAQGFDVIERYSCIVNPNGPVHPYVWTLTGISPIEVDNAPPLEEYLDELLDKIEGIPIFAHNAQYDQSVLNGELERRDRPIIGAASKKRSLPWICTVEWARKLLPGHRKYKLGLLAQALGIQLDNAHRGLADAEATQQIVCKIAQSAERRDWDLFDLVAALSHGEVTPKQIAQIWDRGND